MEPRYRRAFSSYPLLPEKCTQGVLWKEAFHNKSRPYWAWASIYDRWRSCMHPQMRKSPIRIEKASDAVRYILFEGRSVCAGADVRRVFESEQRILLDYARLEMQKTIVISKYKFNPVRERNILFSTFPLRSHDLQPLCSESRRSE